MFTPQQKQNWQENITPFQPFGRWSTNYSLRHTFCDRQGQGVLQLIGYGDTTGSNAFNPSDIGSTNLGAAISEDISYSSDPFNVFLTQIQGGGGKLIETVLISTLTDFVEETLSIPEANTLRIFIGEQEGFSQEGTGFPNTPPMFRLVGEIDLPAINREQTPRDFPYRNWIYVPPSGNLYVGLAQPALYGVSFKVWDLQGFPKLNATPFVASGGDLSTEIAPPDTRDRKFSIDVVFKDATWETFKPITTTPPTYLQGMGGIINDNNGLCPAVQLPVFFYVPNAEFRTIRERVELPPLLEVTREYVFFSALELPPDLDPNKLLKIAYVLKPGAVTFVNSPYADANGFILANTTGGGGGQNGGLFILNGVNRTYFRDTVSKTIPQFKYLTRLEPIPVVAGPILPAPASLNCVEVPGCVWRDGACAEGEVSRGWVSFAEGTLNQCCLPDVYPDNDRGCSTCSAATRWECVGGVCTPMADGSYADEATCNAARQALGITINLSSSFWEENPSECANTIPASYSQSLGFAYDPPFTAIYTFLETVDCGDLYSVLIRDNNGTDIGAISDPYFNGSGGVGFRMVGQEPVVISYNNEFTCPSWNCNGDTCVLISGSSGFTTFAECIVFYTDPGTGIFSCPAPGG